LNTADLQEAKALLDELRELTSYYRIGPTGDPDSA